MQYGIDAPLRKTVTSPRMMNSGSAKLACGCGNPSAAPISAGFWRVGWSVTGCVAFDSSAKP